MLIFGRVNVEAGRLMGSPWFSHQWDPELPVLSILRDASVNALFLGYRDMPGLATLAPWQHPLDQSFVAPFWTLSIVFYGSIAIMLLCWCAGRSRPLWWFVVLFGSFFLFCCVFVCFFVGHLMAAAHRAEQPVSTRQSLPIALVISGVACCVLADVWRPGWLSGLCYYETSWLFPGQLPPMQQKAIGAMLALAGIIDLQGCWNVLSRSWLVAYSRLSFPIYLVHWAIMCGPAAAALLYLNTMMGVTAAQICALTFGIAASVVASVVFVAVDQYAVRLSSQLRRRSADPSNMIQFVGS